MTMIINIYQDDLGQGPGWGAGDFAPLGHLHDGDILEHDGVDSDGGVFPYDTTDTITFDQSIIIGGNTLDSLGTLDIIPSGLRDVKFYADSGAGVSQTVSFYGRNAGLSKFMSLRVGLNGVAAFSGNVDAYTFDDEINVSKDQDALTEISISNDNSGTDIRHTSLGLYDGITEKAFVEYWNNSEEMHVGTFGVASVLFLESGDGTVAAYFDENQDVGIGTVSPEGRLHIAETDLQCDIVIERIDASVGGGNDIGNINFRAGEVTIQTVGQIKLEANEAFTATASGTGMVLSTTTIGTLNLVAGLTIDANQNVAIANGDLACSENIGIGNNPTIKLDVNAKSGKTTEGGDVIKLTNKTGANSVKGQLVKTDTANDDAVILTGANDDEGIGVFYEAGVADGAEAWIVTGGIADVAMNDNLAATHGNWVGSGEAGYCINQVGPPAAPTHFEEQGHCTQTVAAGGAGTHILSRCVLHQL